MTDKEFLDKVHGCWYGKCLGGAAGAPKEGIKKLIDISDFTEIYNPDLPNDDLDLQLLWLDVLEKKGFNITSCDLADAWIKQCWYPFSEYGYFMKNYMRGIKPPYSGIINNSFFKEGMGCPIRSEIWGIICAGRPELAVKYAYIDGCLDHADNSIYAEQFLAAVESMAFFEGNIEKLINDGMKYIPSGSKLHKCFEMILDMQDKPWQYVRQETLNKFGHPDFTNVVQNLGIVIIALLYGNGDMRETINIALKCGYDTDCTCASAASIIGIIKGYNGLGDLTKLISDYFICGVDVHRLSDSIKRLAEDTAKLAKNLPENVNLKLEYPTKEGLETAKRSIEPVKWQIYGPYYDQLNQPMNPDYPNPHGEGCVLPDLVCMVNNEAFLDTEYEKGALAYTINAYEDLIEVDKYITMGGQYACIAETTVVSSEDKKVWVLIGNNDAFSLCVNGEKVLEKDEIRLWTPQNNFCLIELKKGENKVSLKLLRRTESLKFSIGFRIYNGEHWHKNKWCTDLKFI
ncbi:MAG: ADP-ribosylglycohydrolase family protein [Clostridiaceae bacterium]|nr:ADP-ribosylglycohydrolase family protein [Clostridiaceae bacterium]